jgi:hypothetical protein
MINMLRETIVTGRTKAGRDLKIRQGQRRDAYFQRLRRQAQLRRNAPAA